MCDYSFITLVLECSGVEIVIQLLDIWPIFSTLVLIPIYCAFTRFIGKCPV